MQTQTQTIAPGHRFNIQQQVRIIARGAHRNRCGLVQERKQCPHGYNIYRLFGQQWFYEHELQDEPTYF